MRTSTTATSGLCAPTLRSRSSPSPAWPTTSKPDVSNNRAMPSRSSTVSSAPTPRPRSCCPRSRAASLVAVIFSFHDHPTPNHTQAGDAARDLGESSTNVRERRAEFLLVGSRRHLLAAVRQTAGRGDLEWRRWDELAHLGQLFRGLQLRPHLSLPPCRRHAGRPFDARRLHGSSLVA